VVERQRSEEARLRALIDNMPAHVYLRDLSGRFILANQQYEEFWGLPHDYVRGRSLFDTAARSKLPQSPAVNAQVDREVRLSGRPRRRESRVLRNGKEHIFEDVRFPVRDSSGVTVAIAGIDIDITAQKRSEAELSELLSRVEMARDSAMEAASAKSR